MFEDAIDATLVRNLALALFIGGMVGVERERKLGPDALLFGGLRTFVLIAEAGAVAGWLTDLLDSVVPVAVGGLVVGVLVAIAYHHEAVRKESFPGLTTEFAALVVFLLGVLCAVGQAEAAIALGVVTAAVLAYKPELHGFVDRIGREDVGAALKLLFATFVVLPLLPREPVDPWGILVPWQLWWLVILISGLSLAGYVAVRLWGAQLGLLLTGAAGGAVSSTAVTLTLARRSIEHPTAVEAIGAGILVAWTMMFPRVLIEVAVVNPSLLPALALPIGALGLATAGFVAIGFLRGRQESRETTDVPLRNPFSLGAAIRFALLFAAILLLVGIMREHVPDSWLYALAALAGTTSVDAITLSIARVSGGELSEAVAVNAIVIAVVSNTLVKCGMVVALGSRALGWRIGIATLLILVIGGAFALAPRLL